MSDADFDKIADILESKGGIGSNDDPSQVKDWVDYGFLPLNAASSGDYDKGAPQGRIIEIIGGSSAGKTFLATRLMADGQAAGGIACFNDHERSFSEKLGEKNGLSLRRGRWIYKKPDTYEESLEIFSKVVSIIRTSKLIPADAPIVYVFDSLAAMIPASQFGKDFSALNMNDTTALARLTSQTMKSVAVMAEKFNVTVIFLNQIREKPGVCLRGDAIVPFTDGTHATMREIVEGKISKKVWSYNEKTGEVEEKTITQWHDNGEIADDEDWLSVKTTGTDTPCGFKSAVMTGNHKVLSKGGSWKEAKSLKAGDVILAESKEIINGSLGEFVEAMMMGDCGVSSKNDVKRKSASFTVRDNNDPEYVQWKVDKLSGFIEFKKRKHFYNGHDLYYFQSVSNHEIGRLKGTCRSFDLAINFRITPMSLAVWIMDDANLGANKCYSIAPKRFSVEEVIKIADRLYDEHGFVSHVNEREKKITFNVESSERISSIIAPFVPKCMERKVLECDRGKFVDFNLTNEPKSIVIEETVVSVSKAKKSEKNDGLKLYDIGVEDNHSFLVGGRNSGFFVHNCYGDNTTTPGGNALKYYASQRIKLSSSKIFRGTGESKEVIGNEVSAVFIKNKVSRPFKKVKWNVLFQEDGSVMFDTIGSTLDFMLKNDMLEKNGHRIVWEGKNLYRDALIEHLRASGGIGVLNDIIRKNGVKTEEDAEAAKIAEEEEKQNALNSLDDIE